MKPRVTAERRRRISPLGNQSPGRATYFAAGRLGAAEAERLAALATRMRALVRVKVADDADLDQVSIINDVPRIMI